jgi:hypothetical protein
VPLSAEAQRARRKRLKAQSQPPKFPRRRCANCNNFFLKTRKNKRFCKRECKNEFNRYGSAFGPLKDWLTKFIEQRAKEETVRRTAALEERISQIEEAHKTLRFDFSLMSRED